MPHDCRCNKCKSVIYAMFFRIYDEVEFKPKFENASVRLEDYEGKRVYQSLCKIYKALQRCHRNKSFVKVNNLCESDLYIPSRKLLIEIDELQHFTEERYIALKNYPKGFKLSYDVKAYKQMCKKIKSKDPEPKYRNEQRAWYDSVRDFLPKICPEEVKKVIRIPLGEYRWCNLDYKKDKDIAKFKRLLKSECIWRK